MILIECTSFANSVGLTAEKNSKIIGFNAMPDNPGEINKHLSNLIMRGYGNGPHYGKYRSFDQWLYEGEGKQ
jgi:hypothetical protein